MALTDNLVAYYKLDSNSNDSHGTNHGTDTNISYTTGVLTNAADFNGTTSYIDCGTGIDLGATKFTMNFWYYPNVTYPDSQYRLACAKDAVGDRQFAFGFADNGKCYFERAGTAILGGAGSGSVITAGQFSMVTIYFDASNLYTRINDTANTGPTAMTALVAEGGSFTLGKRVNGGIFMKGRLDGFGVWTRDLTAAEITELYNAGAGLEYPFSSGSAPLFPRGHMTLNKFIG